MASRDAARYKRTDDSSKGKLLNEIESISKALYLDRNPSKSSSSAARSLPRTVDKNNVLVSNPTSKHGGDVPSTKEKKSIWNWKPLKAFSHVRNRRFNCCFSLEVHKIEGLPSKFNDISICVHWKRRDGEVVTSPIKVIKGAAGIEQKLTHTCSVYGSRSGPHHSAKYEAKHFLIYAAVYGHPRVDLGKHRVDLTRLLPLTLEELEDEKSSGTWTTSFKLSGEAKGAVMHVSFGYLVLGDGTAHNNKNMLQLLDSKSTARNHVKSNQGDGKSSMRRAGSLPSNLKSSTTTRFMDDVKVLHEVPSSKMSELSSSVSMLYQKFDQEDSDSLVEDKREIQVPTDDDKPVKSSHCSPSESNQENMLNDENSEFSFVEKGVEYLEEKTTLVEDGEKVVNNQDVMEDGAKVVDNQDVVEDGAKVVDNQDVAEGGAKVVNNQDVVEDGAKVVDYQDVIEDGTKVVDNQDVEDGAKVVDSQDVEDGAKIVDNQDVMSSDLSVVYNNAGVSCQMEADFKRDEYVTNDSNFAEKSMCTKESLLEDLESVLSNVADLEKEGLDTSEAKSESSDQENQNEDEPNMVMPSVSLDDLADTVADEFLSMLGVEDSSFALDYETEPESPRERLLREFEKEAEASGCSLFGFDIDEEEMEDYDYYAPTISGWEEYSEDSDFLTVDQHEYPKIRAKVMEDLETQELMQEWGLDEMAFQSSPPDNRGGFGSPIDLPPIESLQLPSLGEGLGPFVQTKTGGFLRSMNPNHFTNAKSGGSLIMQVSSPVVVPAELGSGVIDILQNLASIGLEKLSVQASKLMPLEDITGRTMQQIAWEAVPRVEASESQYMLQDERRDGLHISDGNKQVKQPSSCRKSKKTSASLYFDEGQSEFVSLEDLAPLAVDKIEALSIEGLRIQSGMSDEEAPSNINAQSIGEVSAVERKGITSIASMGLEGAAGLKLLALENSGVDSDDGLMSLSLTLDEWMKLDSGEIDEDERLSERTSKLLAAHHAKNTDLNMFGRKGDKKQGKGSGRRCGLLGNNFTVALMVQLRDPLRDYEPVGTPMLALIQVERVFVPPKPKIYSTVSAPKDSSDEDDLESVTKEEKKQEPEEKTPEQDFIPQYKISEVHVSGLKTELGKKKLWGSSAQQQSGSRWLLANGMGKGKTSFTKPKIAAKSSLPATVASQPGDTLWSISAKFHGSGAKWKQLAALNPHIRNPNVILPNETIKLR
ncbi:protein PLASTID MOVEMENT IMPAIRED 1-RELATED 1-like [Chenopodium quinoa]|nr:protein PLASTID MOVEMENT IMPAIRED 1-RELATED 1-like [Chenopodium quinoa]XP_021733967.1 protein PLASTID MOVEMENT IMPAIRED 1-RELATED 1-like [Chenopodium quinoa]